MEIIKVSWIMIVLFEIIYKKVILFDIVCAFSQHVLS